MFRPNTVIFRRWSLHVNGLLHRCIHRTCIFKRSAARIHAWDLQELSYMLHFFISYIGVTCAQFLIILNTSYLISELLTLNSFPMELQPGSGHDLLFEVSLVLSDMW
jgi:hypothetical protein